MKKMEDRLNMQQLYWELVKHNISSTRARKLSKAIDNLNTFEYNSLVKILKPLSEEID